MNQRKTRKWTCLLMEAMDGGLMDPRAVADMCLQYMSEYDVEEMCGDNDIKQFIDPDYNEEN